MQRGCWTCSVGADRQCRPEESRAETVRIRDRGTCRAANIIAAYRREGMSAYAALQEREFESERHGYAATEHQRQVGAGYFDEVAQVIAGGQAATAAMAGSTEEEQFN